jgi:hypothetical protein
VLGIAQYKLKCVFSWRQFNTCLRLSAPEMKVFFVLRNCIVWIERFIHVYQQMVMPSVCKIVPGMGYAHIAQTEAAPKSPFNNRAILRIQRVESKRVDEFANMSDEELRQYVYGKELDS